MKLETIWIIGADNLLQICCGKDIPDTNHAKPTPNGPKPIFCFSRFDSFKKSQTNPQHLMCILLYLIYPWVKIHGPQAVQSRQRAPLPPLPASPAETLVMEVSPWRFGARRAADSLGLSESPPRTGIRRKHCLHCWS